MHSERSVERNKRLHIKPLDSQTVHFLASLEDFSEGPEGPEVIHSLVLEGTLSLPDLVIMSVEARALKQPYRECSASVSPMLQLAGLRIGPGFKQKAFDLLGGVRGCSHFLTLVLDLGAAHTLTTYLRIRDQVPLATSDDDDSNWTSVALGISPRLENACIGLQADWRPMTNARRKRDSSV
jgi:hypothetical protein